VSRHAGVLEIGQGVGRALKRTLQCSWITKIENNCALDALQIVMKLEYMQYILLQQLKGLPSSGTY
jgi:hypothetical protein